MISCYKTRVCGKNLISTEHINTYLSSMNLPVQVVIYKPKILIKPSIMYLPVQVVVSDIKTKDTD